LQIRFFPPIFLPIVWIHGRWSSLLRDGTEDADMARTEITGRKAGLVELIGRDVGHIQNPPPNDDFDAFSIAEFCRRHRVSVQLFYKMRDQMPATFRLGTRVLISREAATAWRAGRAAAARTPPDAQHTVKNKPKT
jgi:hypothetical protein